MKMLRNKKADQLTEEILKLVIAVMCLFFLVLLAVGLYNLFTAKNALEQAKASLGGIEGKINSLEKEGDGTDYLVTAPKGWIIVYFKKNAEMPSTCNGKNCLCFCLQGYSSIEQCEKEGVCKGFDKKINFMTRKSDENYISLSSLPRVIFFEKTKEDIIISSVEGQADYLNKLSEYLDEKVIWKNEEVKIKDLLISREKMDLKEGGSADVKLVEETKRILNPIFGENKWAIHVCYPNKKSPNGIEHGSSCWLWINEEVWMKGSWAEDAVVKIKTEVAERINYDNRGETKIIFRLI